MTIDKNYTCYIDDSDGSDSIGFLSNNTIIIILSIIGILVNICFINRIFYKKKKKNINFFS